MTLALAPRDRRLLSGEAGDGARLAMRLLVRAAEVAGAPRRTDGRSARVCRGFPAGRRGLARPGVAAQPGREEASAALEKPVAPRLRSRWPSPEGLRPACGGMPGESNTSISGTTGRPSSA